MRGDWWPTGEGNYPVHLYIKYKDAEGKEYYWSHGFVEENMTDTHGRTNYEVIPANQWYQYISPDLLSLTPKPVTITSVMVGGDGWDYHGQIADVMLSSETNPPVAVPINQTTTNQTITNETVHEDCSVNGCQPGFVCSSTLNQCVKPATEFDQLKVASIVTKLESLGIELSDLKTNMIDIKNYYASSGNTDKINKWNLAIDKVDAVMVETQGIKTYLYDNRLSITDDILDQARIKVAQLISHINELSILIIEAGA